MKNTFEVGDHLKFCLFGDKDIQGEGEFVGFYEQGFVQVRLTKTCVPYPSGTIVLVMEGEIFEHLAKK